MKLVFINIGISGGHRGVIFADRTFVYVPLDNKTWNCEAQPYYEDLHTDMFTRSTYQHGCNTLADLLPSLKGKQAHCDPDFRNMTYGHAKRGWGYEKLLRSLTSEDILLFYATLDYRKIGRK